MYGVDLHPVLVRKHITDIKTEDVLFRRFYLIVQNFCSQGEDSVEYFLGLTPSGIILLRNKTKVGNYYWPRINKIYYKV